jgi:hypothetical protein
MNMCEYVYVVPQYFLLSIMRSVIVFQQQWMMVSASELVIGTRFVNVGRPWSFDSSISCYLCPICLIFEKVKISEYFLVLTPRSIDVL